MWDPINKTGWLNLKGYVIGNGITDFKFDGFEAQAFEMFPYFGLMPFSKFQEYKRNNCKLLFEPAVPNQNQSAECEDLRVYYNSLKGYFSMYDVT